MKTGIRVSAYRWFLPWLFCGGVLYADFIMGPLEVSKILKSINKAQMTLRSDVSQNEKGQALFEIGGQAYTLAKLINAEILSHGNEQQGLIDLAIKRCRDMGVNIEYFPSRAVYLYDGKEFLAYLQTDPGGEDVAEALSGLMERSSADLVLGVQEPTYLLEQVALKKHFLSIHPDFKNRTELELLLAMDYHKLYLACSDRKESTKAQEYKKSALERYRQITRRAGDGEAASYARALLPSLQNDKASLVGAKQ